MEAEKLGEGETLARHRKILTELAARKGLYVEKIYQEIVSGAETIKDRPEIQKLINDAYQGKYRGIIIVEVTRLSRGSQGDAQIILDCLKYANRNNGLLVVTPTKVYDVAHNSDDNNIYKNHYCALNAIDKHFGSYGDKGSKKRKSYGIQVIGKNN